MPNALLLYAVAIVVFTIGILQAKLPEPSTGSPPAQSVQPSLPLDQLLREQIDSVRDTARREAWRMILLVLALGFTAYALNLLWREPPIEDYTLVFLLWLGAIALYSIAAAPPRRNMLGRRLTLDRRQIMFIVAMLLVAGALRIVDLDRVPINLGGDEGTFGLESIKTITGEINNPFSTAWFSVPTLSFYYNSLGVRLFGNSALAVRLPWAVLGTVTVVLYFFLVRRLRGLSFSVMATTLLAFYAYHIHFSRLGANNIADPFFVTVVLLLFYRALDEAGAYNWVLTGITIGLAQYFYFGGRFNAVITGALIVFLTLREGKSFLRAHGRGIVILIGAALITAAPLIQYALRRPDDYNARINQIGIIQSGWLEREQEIRRQSAAEILLDQLQRAALAFNAYPDRTAWYGAPEPLFDPASAILFLLGLGYATLHMGDRRLFPMLAWWWGAMILGGALTESPPSSQRLITLAPPAIFFVTLALEKIGHIFKHTFQPNARRLAPWAATVVLALGLRSSLWYFTEFTPTRLYGSLNGMIATEIAHYMRDQLGSDWRIYFFGPPEMYIEFGSIPFLAPQVEGVDIVDPLTEIPPSDWVADDKNVAFIFLENRLDELELLRPTFPDGEFQEFRLRFGLNPEPIMMFAVYKIPLTSASR